MNKSNVYIITFLAIAIIVSGLSYLCIFHAGLSHDGNDWVTFGTFFSGIASLLNVIVFVWLTITIQESDKKSKERDRDNQKRIILSRLRYDELQNLSSLLNQVTDFEPRIDNWGKLSHISYSLNSFFQSRKALFPILNDDKFNSQCVDLCKLINDISKILRTSGGFNEKGLKVSGPTPVPPQFSISLVKYQNQRIEIISKFEQFIIDDISSD
jgi:hypothetical protein